MNFQALKDALIQDTGVEEKVEVNQRHLIDKILARYSAEHTVFRELLQNSNDAGASIVKISFLTDGKRAKTVVYENNGRPFSEPDFARLRKIAEGNPDEQKIGFFGVGFYSLFSICEEPFVTSGNQSMAFLWKGDMLYTKKGIIPPESITEWTGFYLNMREPLDVPDAIEFGTFLATSMAFTSNIRQIEVYRDSERTHWYDKKVSESRPLPFALGEYTLSSPTTLLKLESVSMRNIQLDVEIKAQKINFLGAVTQNDQNSVVFMRVAVGSLAVMPSKRMEKEMERTTKKKPPAKSDIQIIYSNYDEFEGSDGKSKKSPVFENLILGPSTQGKIFIGFPTHQTTGCSIHMAAHLIPTVERESIDFVDPTLNTWNQEMLAMGGLVARILCEDDLDSTARLYTELKLDAISESWLQNKAIHNLKGFTFQNSTPISLVGRLISTSFYKYSTRPVRLVSSKGILPCTQVRLRDPEMSEFLKTLPVVPEAVEAQCQELLKRLKDLYAVRLPNLDDVFVELSSRTFSVDQTVALFRWWIQQWRQGKVKTVDSQRLKNNLLITDSKSAPQTMQNVVYYTQPKLVPADLPLPNSVLPLEISKFFINPELEQALWGLREFRVLDWLAFITKDERFGLSPEFTEKVISVFSRHFGYMTTNDRNALCDQLRKYPCIVTKQGMRAPLDCYFKYVNLFHDLPTVHFTGSKSVSDVFLKALGVREHVDLQTIFDRLTDLDWDHVMLIRYLASVQDKLSEIEWGRLKATSMFPKEPISIDSPVVRMKAADLYEPHEAAKQFSLPALEWKKSKWRTNSDESKFMKRLGLRSFVPVDELLELAASSHHEKRMALLRYFTDSYGVYYSTVYRPNQVNIAFLPVTDSERLMRTVECYSDVSASVMGFPILHHDLKIHADKFGVAMHPPSQKLLLALRTSPPAHNKATQVFSYLASRQHEFDRDDWSALKVMSFVPVVKDEQSFWMAPTTVYFGKASSMHGNQFIYVDFDPAANAFLSACGVKDEPSPIELAEMLVRSPEQNLKMMGFDGYMTVLRQLAVHYPTLQGNKKLLKEMKARAFLVGIRANGANPTTANSPEPETLFKLARAEDIYLIDDTVLGQLFNPLGAPIEVILENMYQGLGSQWLSQNVKEITTPTGAQFSSHRSLSLEELIQQRAPLLLYDGQQLRNSKDVLPHAEAYLKTIKVVEVPSIEVSRRFQEVTKIQKTTACLMANRNTKSYFLYVTADFDHFDVASSLGRIIFKQVRLNDSLLLSTLLSTSLENLRRKGFPVDRILNLTQHLKLAKPVAELQKTAGSVEDLKQLQSMFPSIDPILIKTELERAQGTEDPLAIAANSIVEKATAISKTVTPTRRDAVPPSPQHREPTQGKTTEEQGGGGLSQMFNRFSGSMLKNLGIASPVVDKPHSVPPPNLPVTKNIDAPNTRTRSITPQSTQAIKSQLSQSVSTLSTIKDSQFRAQIPSDPDAVIPTPQSRENPCRIIADADLIQVQTIEGILLYVDRNVGQTEVNRLLSDDLQGLIRFSLVLKFLGQIFGIPLSSMAIYWDQTGDTIAFNRSRSLFFNARYYLGLHYVKVNHGGNTVSLPGSFSSQVPQILDEDLNTFYYWFMVLCHELAHNFVAAHDANHEFWMSSFAEQYLSRLIQSLQQSGLV